MPDIRYTFPKPTHGSQEWLNVRWKDEDGLSRISASVAAALHGQHPYTSMADLAVELLSPEPPTPSETNAAMDRGNRLEPVLVQWFADLEKVEVKTPEEMYAFESEDGKLRLIATLDGITPDGIPVEIKTSNKIKTPISTKIGKLLTPIMLLGNPNTDAWAVLTTFPQANTELTLQLEI